MKKIALLLVALSLTACASGVYPVGGGTYFVNHSGISAKTEWLPGEVGTTYSEASDFCAKNGKQIYVVNRNRDELLTITGNAGMTFRCVDK